jgi:hypothetical protein
MEIIEVIHNIDVATFKRIHRVNFPNATPDQSITTLKTAWAIWALNGFSFTHLRIIYKKGGRVTIPMPVNIMAYKQTYKKTIVTKLLSVKG